MIWFGLAAASVGVLVFAMPIRTEWQVILFSAASIVFLGAGRALWSGKSADVSDKPLLNKRAEQLIGHTFVLATPIIGGRGRIIAGDGQWSVRGPDLPESSLVRVVGAEGTVLLVESAQ